MAALMAILASLDGFKTYLGAAALVLTGLTQVFHVFMTGVGSPLAGIALAVLGWIAAGLRHFAAKALRVLADKLDAQTQATMRSRAAE